MSIRIHIGGRPCSPQEAAVPVFDRGFLFGDSVYEAVGTNRGRLVFLDDHLDRLARSAERIYLRLPRVMRSCERCATRWQRRRTPSPA